jgi:hypothetical protein
MDSTGVWSRWPARLAIGLAAGVAIAAVDSFAFKGEVSPIIVVAILLAATVTSGAIWGRRGWVPAAAAWASVPLAHLFKRILGLPDTLQPNTYASLLMLAAFTLAVALAGTGCGVLLRRLTAVAGDGGPKRSQPAVAAPDESG